MVDAKLGEGLKNYKGDNITPDLSETAQNSPSLQAGIGAMLDKPTQANVYGITALKNDEEGLLNKYDRYSLEEIKKDKVLQNSFKKDLLETGIDLQTNEGKERMLDLIKRLKADDEKFPTSSIYKKINADASKILSRGQDTAEFRDIKKAVPESKVTQIVAEALLNRKISVLQVMNHLGYLPSPSDKEKLAKFKADLKQKIGEIQSRKKESDETRKANNEAV